MTLVDALLIGLVALSLLTLILLVLLWRRSTEPALAPEPVGPLIQQSSERLDRSLRDELNRVNSALRQDTLATLSQFQQSLLTQGGDVARTQNEQIDSFRVQLGHLQQSLAQQAATAREAQDTAAARLGSLLTEQLQALAQRNEAGLAETRRTVEARLQSIQQDNEKKLEQMRATVDEKLHATLEQRLGESFKQVAERLEQVYRGLGEMQTLARDVGSLNRVLTNVKTRGIFGEVQLAGLLEQVFTPEQYASNVETVPGTGARVEFALKLPGQRDDGQPLWLPIDAKFPREDYERLLEAQERADAPAADQAGRAIETRLRLEAKTIREKYLGPPHTTDFALLFLPTEGLYAEALRRPGLTESLQRDYKVMLVGPTTLLATLSSLQMGFRTLALEKRSAEVWEVLSAVKTEFGKFGEVLAKTKKKLEEASNTIDAAEVRTRAMTRRLKTVEALPDDQMSRVLQLGQADEEGAAG
ncbi:DNA recombination protein RmuC [Roseateles sp. SL47]|jgi:DNA recombination protein RmuC|uniref:DNA recombination protein RmuC n=1 Tax=Roseateles sp. SL47 TaxID=2995138 RepID=UPI00226D986E|nr:DNA recombination protein RmuC [Roseateles sp. SL47]WAC75133.1 DNA recombination protein RmuC [Roseateles sp. SL47]